MQMEYPLWKWNHLHEFTVKNVHMLKWTKMIMINWDDAVF